MAAPSIIGAETPYNARPFGGIVEDLLRWRGMTNSSYSGTDTTYTSATAIQLAEAQRCVQRGLAFVMDRFREIWPYSEADATAESDYTRVLLPLDFNDFGKGGAFYTGKRLTLLTPREYANAIRPDSEGGGVTCADVAGTPSHARVVVVQNTESSVVYYRLALDVFPRQAAAWTVHLIYVAGAKSLTSDTLIMRVPVKLEPVLENRCRAEWLLSRGDTKGAAEYLSIVEAEMDAVYEGMGDQMPMRVVSGYPHDVAQE